MRAQNEQLVVRAIRRQRTMTRTDLTNATGLAKSTIKDIVDGLVASGLLEVQEVGPDGRVGRPASPVQISRSAGCVLGADIGADKVLASVARLDGHIIGSARQPTHDLRGKTVILKVAQNTIEQALSDAGVEPSALLAAVIGTPGVIHPDTGRVSLAPQIEGWNGIDLREELRPLLQTRVVMRRQADLSALAEVALGVAQNMSNVLYIHIGIGVGAALLINGHLYEGNDGAAGEIGYLPLAFGEDRPGGTTAGPFEWAAGGSAFARLGARAARRPSGKRLRELAGGDADRVNAAAVFAAAAEGDPEGVAVAEELSQRLSTGIASAVCVVNPELTVISGGISLAGPLLLNMIRDRMSKLVPVMPRLALSSLGDQSVVAGAIEHGVDVALDRALAIG
jgi:glucokinase